MACINDDWLRTLWCLNAIVVGEAGHWKHALNGAASEAGLRFKSLEAEIAAGHDQRAAVLHPLGEKLQAIRCRLPLQPRFNWEQE